MLRKEFWTLDGQRPQSVVALILDRPDCKNALSVALAKNLADELEGLAQSDARLILLSGANECFSAGGDLKAFYQQLDQASSLFDAVSRELNRAILCIERMPQIVIAAVDGPAYAAAFGLVLSCDLIVATQRAKLSPSFIHRALAPNASSSYFLPRLVGTRRAMEIMYSGEVLSAEQALRLGLINRVFHHDDFDQQVREYLKALMAKPESALRRHKYLLRQSKYNDLATQLDLEREQIAMSGGHVDFAQGLHQFFGKA